MSVNKLAKELYVPANRLSQIINGKRGISPDPSLRLARYFGFAPEHWLNMQAQYDFEIIRRQSIRKIEKRSSLVRLHKSHASRPWLPCCDSNYSMHL
jgi:antitoxin HigA-1